MSRKIVVTSGKGGVGKTTIVALLGIALALKKQKVLVVDLDIGLNNLDVSLNIEQDIVYDLVDVIEEKCTPKQAIIQNKTVKNLFVLPACHFYKTTGLRLEQLPMVINFLAKDFDFVLLDCPAGIDNMFKVSLMCANEAIVVVTPTITSLKDADKVVSKLFENSIPITGVVVNKIRGDLVLKKQMFSHLDVSEILKLPCLGVVPDVDCLSCFSAFECFTLFNKRQFYPFCLIANNLLKDKKDIVDYTKQYRGICGILRLLLKKLIK